MKALAQPVVRASSRHQWNAAARIRSAGAGAACRRAPRSKAQHLKDTGGVTRDEEVVAVDTEDRLLSNQAAAALSVDAARPGAGSPSEESSSPWTCHLSEDSQFFDWKYNSKLHYVHRGTAGPAVLLVHGFGVGCYQFEENMRDLSREHSVWAIDLLGQGCSWPLRQPQASDNLQYSLDTWTEQLADFVRDVIREPVYVAGNSLGGLLSVSLAARHPELVSGVILLNAAPFWSFAPRPGTLLARFMPYDGTVPAPSSIKEVIGKYWFSRLSDPGTIQELIRQVYCTNSMIDADFLDKIVASTKHPEALEAFASIMFSPAGSMSFSEMVARIEAPMCMIYGRDDPWIVPLWGQRLKRLVPSIDYFELSPAGHCPHHEAPVTVDTVMRDWIGAKRAGAKPSLAVGASMTQTESDGRRITITHTHGLPRNVFEHLDYNVWRLRNFFSRWRRKEGKEAASA